MPVTLLLAGCSSTLPRSCPPDCAGVDLREADLTEVDLNGANLSHADLSEGYLKDYGKGEPTQKQWEYILSEIKKHSDSCEIIVRNDETIIKVNFNN